MNSLYSPFGVCDLNDQYSRLGGSEGLWMNNIDAALNLICSYEK